MPPRRPSAVFPARALAPVVGALVGLAALTGCASFGPEVAQPQERRPTAPPAASATPVVMFLGDSYTVGNRHTRPEAAYAAATARLLGWQVIIGGRAGTGFVSTGTRTEAFDTLFEAQLGWRPAPDLLIVSGGHNDSRYPPAQVGRAATELLARASRRWPGTRQVLIGPMWGHGTPPPQALAVRDALAGVAQRAGAPFIDPLQQGWITGSRTGGQGNAHRYIRPDNVHPTEAGHRYLASRLVQELRRLKLTKPSRSS